MMRKIYRLLLTILCMAMLLSGCVWNSDSEETQPQEESNPPTTLHYRYSELDFSLVFPETWEGRFAVQRVGSCVTVSIDDTPTFSVVSLRNELGAREEDLRLEEEGYSYYRENGTHFFYYKILAMLPDELYMEYRRDKNPQWHTKDAMYNCWRINWETETCTVVEDGDFYYLSMKKEDYINHRLGIAIVLPKPLLQHGSVYLKPQDYANQRVIDLVLRERWLPGERLYDYLIATIVAMPVGDPLRDPISIVDYPELTHLDGMLYGVANEWRNSSWKPGLYTLGWETYPEHIQSMFSYEDVQEVVDSFQILSP